MILRGSRLAIVVKGGWARGFFDNDSRAPTLPGKHITDHQARLYMDFHRINATNVAAAKAGFSSSTGRRLDNDLRLPSQKRSRAVAAAPIRWPMSGTLRSCRC